MRIEIMTLFPEMCEAVLGSSIIGRARKAGLIDIYCRQIRDYAFNRHNHVDDTPYGGGMGMVMQCEPIYRCYEAVCDRMGTKPHTIYMSPKGKVFTQERAKELSKMENIAILCGHYEGVDQRIIDKIVDEEISVGDYVLTGGELRECVTAYFQAIHVSWRKAYTADCLNILIIQDPKYGKAKEFPKFFFRVIMQIFRSGERKKALK